MSADAVRLAPVSPEFVDRARPGELSDWLSYFEPSVVVLTGREPAPREASILRRQLDTGMRCFQPAGRAPSSGVLDSGGVQLFFASDSADLRTIAEQEGTALDPNRPTYVLSDLLALDVDKTSLSTSLHGWNAYVDALDPDRLDGEYIHLSTGLPTGYRREWSGLALVGAGVGSMGVDASAGIDASVADTALPALDCTAAGRVLVRELDHTRLGLRALDGVGHKRASKLHERGFHDRADVAAANPADLTRLPGMGRQTATRITESARAIDSGEVVPRGDGSLPTGEPVFIDIETDGLSPTITWLIGVLDGSASDGAYMAFLQKDPDEPGRAVADFMAWYAANASHRPLVAYNGWRFDFSVLHDHIVEYCPEFLDDWTNSYRFDPYQWAVEEGNAVLPGQTNKLEDVAGALGYDRAEAGLTGAAVARTYKQWMTERSSATEPDWDAFRRYCEDDVRALATVYERLQESSRIVSEPRDRTHTGETTQGTLSDW